MIDWLLSTGGKYGGKIGFEFNDNEVVMHYEHLLIFKLKSKTQIQYVFSFLDYDFIGPI